MTTGEIKELFIKYASHEDNGYGSMRINQFLAAITELQNTHWQTKNKAVKDKYDGELIRKPEWKEGDVNYPETERDCTIE